MSNHISELCIQGDLEKLTQYLMQQASPIVEAADSAPRNTAGGGIEGQPQPQSQQPQVDDVSQVVTKDDALRVVANYQDDEGRTPLHWALSVKAKAPLVTALLGPPFCTSPITTDGDGLTPLMTAVAADFSADVLQALLNAAGATADGATNPGAVAEYINQRDKLGNTALIAASSRGNTTNIRLLLEMGADLSVQNKRRQNALHRAVSRGSMDASELLVTASRKQDKHRAFLNAQDVEGNTPLHYAALENNQELGEHLLRHGAIREKKNKEGKEFWEL